MSNPKVITLKQGESIIIKHEIEVPDKEGLVNLSEASRQLGISRTTLYDRMEKKIIPFEVRSMTKKIHQSTIDDILNGKLKIK